MLLKAPSWGCSAPMARARPHSSRSWRGCSAPIMAGEPSWGTISCASTPDSRQGQSCRAHGGCGDRQQPHGAPEPCLLGTDFWPLRSAGPTTHRWPARTVGAGREGGFLAHAYQCGPTPAPGALARSLLAETPLLFLDEPTNKLDIEGVRSVRQMIADLNPRARGHHHPDDACDGRG